MTAWIVAAAAALAVGDDPARAGSLQKTLEARLGASAIGASAIAAARERAQPGTARPSVDAAWRKRGDELLTRVAREYYEGRLDDALLSLGGLDAHLATSPHAPARDRVALLLWRTAIFLERGDKEAARSPAADALALDPALVVDEKVFPPSVSRTIAELKAKPARTAMLTLTGLPARAQVTIDDKPRPSAANRLPAGKHRVFVTAPGYEWLTLDVDIAADVTLAISLPPAIDPALRAMLMAAMRRGSVEATERDAIELAMAPLGADAFAILGSLGPEPRRLGALVFARDRVVVRHPGPDSPQEEAAALEWITKRLPRRGSVRTPRARTPSGFDVEALALGGIRMRTLSASNGSFTSALPSAGPLARATFTQGRLLAEGELGYAFSPSTVEVRLADGTKQDAGGGSTIRARLGAGVRQPIGGVTLGALVGLSFESHSSADVAGLFASYQRAAPELSISAAIPAGAARVDGVIRVVPVASYSETPSGATGRSPEVAPGIAFRIGASVPRGGWRISAALEGERRDVQLKGQGRSELDPPLEDARIEETSLSIGIAAGRSF